MNPVHELLTSDRSSDLFLYLQETNKPIVIYGMGDGAAKLIYALQSKGIHHRDIFASDEFVRGQSFMGQTVKTFSQCRELYGDFIVLVAFSSYLPSVIENLEQIAQKCELFIPDINVYGDPGEVFDLEFLRKHSEDLAQVFDLLSDRESKAFYRSLLRYKLSGKPTDLWQLDHVGKSYTEYFSAVETYCDLGAYTGDTIREQARYSPNLNTVVAFEPEPRHFKKLEVLKDQFTHCYFINAAAYDKTSVIDFSAGKGRGSSAALPSMQGLRRAKNKAVPTQTLDQVTFDYGIPKVDLIKYDVEGCEYQALKGSLHTILTHKCSLVVSLYHNHNDLFRLPLFLKKHVPNASFFLSRKRRCFPAWETELTIIQ